MRKFLNRLWLNIFPTWKRKQSSPRGTKSPIQDKPKEEFAKNHTNQTTKTKCKERILKGAREKQQVNTREAPYA